MIQIPKEVQDFIREHHVEGQPGTVGCFSVVVEREGMSYPNLSPRNFLIAEDGTLVVLDLYSEWLEDVLEEDQPVSCVFVDEEQLKGYIITGRGSYHKAGTIFDDAQSRVEAMRWRHLRGVVHIWPQEVRLADMSPEGGRIMVSEIAAAGG